MPMRMLLCYDKEKCHTPIGSGRRLGTRLTAVQGILRKATTHGSRVDVCKGHWLEGFNYGR